MSHRGKLVLLPANRVWRTYPGGRTLDELARRHGEPLAGGSVAADTHLAEDWIASTTRAVNPPQAAADAARSPLAPRLGPQPGISAVRLGAEPGLHNFSELLASDPEYFLGSAHARKYGPQPQLLVKYLDSGTRLHFQVHPTRDFARRVLGAPSGKTEAYHVLAVRDSGLQHSAPDSQLTRNEPTGFIYVGFQRPPSPAQLRQMILSQDIAAIEACFDKIPVRPGDTFIIPGGTPHALGAGVFMIEIQEPSDLVIRFEFERAGFVLPESSRFMNRDVDFALTVFNFDPLTPADLERRVRCQPRRIRNLGARSWQDELIGAAQTDCFRVLKTHLGEAVVKDENSPAIAIVTGGDVIAEVGGESHVLRTYDKVFLPAGLGPVKLSPAGTDAEIVECLPPA
jgi:mannose-6-phosphate isomerase